jgi:hypothetical protein
MRCPCLSAGRPIPPMVFDDAARIVGIAAISAAFSRRKRSRS